MGMGRVTKTVAKMEKIIGPSKPIFIGVAGVALVMLLLSFSPSTSFPNMFDVSKMTILREKDGAATKDCTTASDQGLNLGHDPADQTFYDDPTLSYEIGNPGKNWDEKRREWLKHHPSFATGVEDRVFVLTGSQPSPCKNPIGDHLNLRLFKNKVDYCRIHGYDIFYNNALCTRKWSIVFTDMDFKLPLDKYKDYNFVVHGWSYMVYEKKSWGGVNAGISGLVTKNTRILMTIGSVYLLLKGKETWGNKIYIESEYELNGYWGSFVDSFDNISDSYARIEKGVAELQRRHAEKVSEHYATVMREAIISLGGDGGGAKRPFITILRRVGRVVGCTGDTLLSNATVGWKRY
ncbi:hypothetical protein C3L33_18506, partial [Rhododendron williamsianum]